MASQSRQKSARVLVFSGGVGGAKLVWGLAQVLAPSQLVIVANTGDDFEHGGLQLSPDLDTLLYTLAGKANTVTGWGLEAESWNVMKALEGLGGETWFRLGDRDLATHLYRSQRLAQGDSLTEVTAALCRCHRVAHTLLPMTDDCLRTMVLTPEGELSFQQYFVREACRPRVLKLRFAGCERARPQPDWFELLASPSLKAVIVCPSNPFLSVDPILALPGVRAALRRSRAPVMAVSPIVAGQALRGPAARIMEQLGLRADALAVADHYHEWLDLFVLDQHDAGLAAAVRQLGLEVLITNTIMQGPQDKRQLAEILLAKVGLS